MIITPIFIQNMAIVTTTICQGENTMVFLCQDLRESHWVDRLIGFQESFY